MASIQKFSKDSMGQLFIPATIPSCSTRLVDLITILCTIGIDDIVGAVVVQSVAGLMDGLSKKVCNSDEEVTYAESILINFWMLIDLLPDKRRSSPVKFMGFDTHSGMLLRNFTLYSGDLRTHWWGPQTSQTIAVNMDGIRRRSNPIFRLNPIKYSMLEDDFNRCLNCGRDADSSKATISAPLLPSSSRTIDGSVASFRAGSKPEVTSISPVDDELDTASEGSPPQRGKRVVGWTCHAAAFNTSLRDINIILPAMSSNASHLSLGDSVYSDVHGNVNNFYSTKRRGGESEGWSPSFMTPTISSIQNTQPEFQTILVGDITLLTEIRLNGTQGTGIRQLYRAGLEGRNTGRMIVAIYQGHGAEEGCR
ncbi:hypothetical protein C8J57DRAFT_1482963 [Mycena rebaudengoi]|nr:hypothetical protein C8J57DRAFT_1482963 [Mycena rebaudengoi]